MRAAGEILGSRAHNVASLSVMYCTIMLQVEIAVLLYGCVV
jgi:hypothetical protein